jgi:hypothetical protein
MANQAIQRLVAAGASPARAKAFTQSVINKVPAGLGAMPAGLGAAPELGPLSPMAPMSTGKVTATGLKPQGPKEWYNDNYGAASDSVKQKKGLPGWTLPEFNSPEIEPYFDYSYGKGSYKKAKDKVSFAIAPNLYKSSKSNLYDKTIYNLVSSGRLSLPQILNKIVLDADAGVEALDNFPVTNADGDVVQAASAYATTLFDEYAKLQSGFAQKLIEINPQFQDYRYNIPSSKTKYGITTNFKLGTIDVLNNDKALSKYNERKAQLNKDKKLTPVQIDAALAKYKTFLAKDVNKAGRTPAKDEQQRRDRLAGK